MTPRVEHAAALTLEWAAIASCGGDTDELIAQLAEISHGMSRDERRGVALALTVAHVAVSARRRGAW